jgi:bacterioferritin
VRRRDDEVVEVAQARLEQHLDAVRQRVDRPEAAQGVEAVHRALAERRVELGFRRRTGRAWWLVIWGGEAYQIAPDIRRAGLRATARSTAPPMDKFTQDRLSSGPRRPHGRETLPDRHQDPPERRPPAHRAGRRDPGYTGDRETILRLLNEALATELVCVLRYKRHYYMATGMHAESAAAEFLQHAPRSRATPTSSPPASSSSAASPNFNPDGLTGRSHAEYVEGETLRDMLKEDLIAERIAIDSYREMINYIGQDDSTTRRMLEGILAVEEEHADDLQSLLETTT